MELRHLRYFIAVVETGSFTVAAEQRLHTAQPSLSRQIRDLEAEVGAELLTRTARGIVLTAAGTAFLGHARLALAQVEAAGEAARRAAGPEPGRFALGFLSGHEPDWMPEAIQVLRGEGPAVEISISSTHSPVLAHDLARRRLDAAFLRPEDGFPELFYKPLLKEPLMVVMPAGHRLALQDEISPRDMAEENFIGMSDTAPVLRAIIETYFRNSGIEIRPAHKADFLSMALSLIASTGGVALLPIYARTLLPTSLVGRRPEGELPMIDLVLGYHKANERPLLQRFLARSDEMAARVLSRASGGLPLL